MAALSAVVFTLSWWLGLYLLARDPRNPCWPWPQPGCAVSHWWWRSTRCGWSAWRTPDCSARSRSIWSRCPGGLVRGRARTGAPPETWRGRATELSLVALVAAATLVGAGMAGSVEGPLRAGHWVMFAVISASTLGALVAAVRRRSQPVSVVGVGGGRDVVLRIGQRGADHPARVGAELAGAGVDGRRRCCSVWRWRCGTRSTRAGAAGGHAALVRGHRRGRRALRRPGVARDGGHRWGRSGPHRAHGAAVHQPGDRDRHQRAGRSAGRAAGPPRVLRSRRCAPTAPRCAAPRPRCRCARRARWTTSTTTPSPG